ncbi:MAG: methylated-DNA--[protein]-cysteine S-methyltransferase [Verrucomicrobiota bacterium]
MSDYSRVATVIQYLDEHHEEQPSLSELASVVGLSESHFHRLFRRWAGVTPKDFLQCLTLEHARERLRASIPVLETAIDAGLSGPGRLHDLTVSLVSATPGELRSQGEGMTISFGLVETPFGEGLLAWTGRGVCHFAFRERESDSEMICALESDWKEAEFHEDSKEARRIADQFFNSGNASSNSLSTYVRGTDFQLRVWRALLQLPEGTVTTYSRLASAIGMPKAARAVGAACGANPIGYLIPCHRVIRETGIVQGYRWGAERKRAIIAFEGLRSGD